MNYYSILFDNIPEIVLAHYFSTKKDNKEYDSGQRKIPGIEIMYANKGDWLIDLPDHHFIQHQGELAILPLSITHRVQTMNSIDQKSHYAIHFLFEGKFERYDNYSFHTLISSITSSNRGIMDIYEKRIFLPEIVNDLNNHYPIILFKKLIEEWNSKRIHSKYAASILLQNMLVSISRSCIEGIDVADNNKPASRRHNNNIIEKAIEYIHADYTNIHSVSDIALKLNVNTSYLGTVFKKNMYLSIVDYLNSVRINKAKVLIETSSLSFKEIASQVGVHNQYYFSKLFKDITGITMTEYAKIVLRASQ